MIYLLHNICYMIKMCDFWLDIFYNIAENNLFIVLFYYYKNVYFSLFFSLTIKGQIILKTIFFSSYNSSPSDP